MSAFERGFESGGPLETRRLGEALGRTFQEGGIIAIDGELGSGKTVFVQGLAAGLGVEHPERIHSPTFALIQEHRGRLPLCHVDLYRLEPGEIERLGLEEYWQARAGEPWVIAIEWASRAGDFLKRAAGTERLLQVRFEIRSETARAIGLGGGESWKKQLQRLAF